MSFSYLRDAFVVGLTKNEDLSVRSGGKPAYSVYACRVFRSARRCSCCCTSDFVCIRAGPPCGRSSMGDAHLVAVLRAMLEVRDGKITVVSALFRHGTSDKTTANVAHFLKTTDYLPAPPRPNQPIGLVCCCCRCRHCCWAATPTQTKRRKNCCMLFLATPTCASLDQAIGDWCCKRLGYSYRTDRLRLTALCRRSICCSARKTRPTRPDPTRPRFGKSLLSLGFGRHRCVNIIGFNSAEWFIANMGAIAAGGIAAGIYTSNLPEVRQPPLCIVSAVRFFVVSLFQ